MLFHFVREGFVNETISGVQTPEIILKLDFQDSSIDPKQKQPIVFKGQAKPSNTQAVTFQARSLNEITDVANDCFVGKGEVYSLSHIYAERLVVGDEMEKIIDSAGARFKLPVFYKNGVAGLAQVKDGLFMPVGITNVVLDKKKGEVLRTRNDTAFMMT